MTTKIPSADGKYVLETRKLSVGYQNKTVLSDIDLSIEKGKFISLLGPNGVGKTTLLRTLSRHLLPKSGEVFLMGKPLAHMPSLELAKLIAVVLTEKVSPPLFTVFEFAALGRYPHTDFLGRMSKKDYEIVENALGRVNASDLSDRPFSDLSDGERQKVLVARALAQDPKIMLLDEPTIHLDLKHRVEVMSILRDLCAKSGITVVASMHDVDLAAKVSDNVALIRKGIFSAWGTPEEILNETSVSQLYDFNDAYFSRHLGGIELKGDGGKGRVFVVGGMGSAAMVYRMLAKKGYAVATGVLHEGDLDGYVAASLSAERLICDPMKNINGSMLKQAVTLMDSCEMVVDSGFMSGDLNGGNMEIITAAIKAGKKVVTLRANYQDVYGEACRNADVLGITSIDQLSDILDSNDWSSSIPDSEKNKIKAAKNAGVV